MNRIKFNVNEADRQLIERIADRYMEDFKAGSDLGIPKLDVVMDLQCVHTYLKLDLEELWLASPFNFAHDVGGIRRNLNRETGRLDNNFRPRFIR